MTVRIAHAILFPSSFLLCLPLLFPFLRKNLSGVSTRVRTPSRILGRALPWFRVHAVVMNDPGRLLAVHLMHTGLVSGWAGTMALYEVAAFDPSDMTFNPMWRQGMYEIPFLVRLGVVDSWSGCLSRLRSGFVVPGISVALDLLGPRCLSRPSSWQRYSLFTDLSGAALNRFRLISCSS